jgi:hypothetical protein
VGTERKYTQQEVDSLLAKARAEASPITQTDVVKPQKKLVSPKVEKRAKEAPKVARNRRPLSKAEREQLAADLRLTSSRSDDAVDLISDRINE